LGEIRVALAGVGNCCSALVQGVEYYRGDGGLGLLHPTLGGYSVGDIMFVAAFDIDHNKVGLDLSEAISAEPNKAPAFKEVERTGVNVQLGPSPDRVEGNSMSHIEKAQGKPADVSKALKDAKADLLVNLISGGSDKASRLYAEEAVKAGCGFLNATPSGIVNDLSLSAGYRRAGLPLAGDDLLSQVGATAVHMGLLEFLGSRGAHVDESYQLDVGGGSESIDTLEKTRDSKRLIKTEAVKSSLPYDFPLVSGSADFVDFLVNGRDSFFWVKGTYFGGRPFTIDVKLSTEDAPNAGAVLIDSIRGLKVAMDRGLGGPVEPVCAYGFKRPPRRYRVAEAYRMFREFAGD
jgi:myo-inositol-1-phosphate synthase